MKIEGKGVFKPMAEMGVGKCFAYNGELYMKTDEGTCAKGLINCVSIQYGTFHKFGDDYMVMPVNAKVVIE